MRLPAHSAKSFLMHLIVVALVSTTWQCHAALAQKKLAEQFWLAGRYDGNRVIVYFDAVQFHGTVPHTARRIADPAVGGFFMPMELPTSYVAQFLKAPDMERFALGDRYDLLLDSGQVATVTLTKLVGTEADEEVGNNSFIGALATLENKDEPMYMESGGIFVIRRHRKLPDGKPKSHPSLQAVYAGLQNDPVRFDIQTKIVGLLTEHMGGTAKADHKPTVAGMSPVLAVQAFHLANGKLRYYGRAVWNSGEGANTKTVFAVSAWISPSPTLHILAVEGRESPYDGLGVLPGLYNVVDLGEGRTGIIVGRSGEDSNSTDLVEYRDGVDLRQMNILQSIAAGE